MKYLKQSFFLALMMFFCSAGEDEYKLISAYAISHAHALTTDGLGNAYVIKGNQLLQFDSKGRPKANYSENNLGSLQFIDASDPMKILLFYPDFAQLIILDSKLSPQSNIDLRSININQPLVACYSKESGYWIYDREDDQLKKIDNNLKVVSQSGNLTQLIGYQLQPGMMTEDNGFVYISNPPTGILVFDRYATYYKTVPYLNIENFQVINNDLLFISNNKLFRYDSKSISESEVLTPQHDSIKAARIEQHQLYLLTNDTLKFYSF